MAEWAGKDAIVLKSVEDDAGVSPLLAEFRQTLTPERRAEIEDDEEPRITFLGKLSVLTNLGVY